MTSWLQHSTAAFVQRLLDYWPRSFYTQAGAIREQTVRLWTLKLERYPIECVLQVLTDFKGEESREVAPVLAAVAAACHRAASAGSRPTKPPENEPLLTPEEFARDDASWERLERTSDDPKRIRRWRAAFAKGQVPFLKEGEVLPAQNQEVARAGGLPGRKPGEVRKRVGREGEDEEVLGEEGHLGRGSGGEGRERVDLDSSEECPF